MSSRCITEAARQTARRQCAAPGLPSCATARLPVCPPPDVQPVIEEGKDGINLLGVYQICNPKPTLLAPYPPGAPVGNEVTAQAELDRLRGQVGRQSAALLKLRSQASRARKFEVGWGFYAGLGLTGIAAAIYLARR